MSTRHSPPRSEHPLLAQGASTLWAQVLIALLLWAKYFYDTLLFLLDASALNHIRWAEHLFLSPHFISPFMGRAFLGELSLRFVG